jgi:hypothetical protein
MNLREILEKPVDERSYDDNMRIKNYNIRREMVSLPIAPIPKDSAFIRIGVASVFYELTIPDNTSFIRITGASTVTSTFPMAFYSFSQPDNLALSTTDGVINNNIALAFDRYILINGQKRIYVALSQLGYVSVEFFTLAI